MRRLQLAGLAILIGLGLNGCGPAPIEPGGIVPVAPAVTPVASSSAASQFRYLDAAAEKELWEQFGTTPEQVEAAQKKYAHQRWRFRGKYVNYWASQPSTFEQLAATVEPHGVQPVFFRFQSQEEKDKYPRQETYLFEGTVDNFRPHFGLHFIDGIIVADAQDELAGAWQVMAITAGGTPVPAEKSIGVGLKYVFNGNQVSIQRSDRPSTTSTFRCGPQGRPRQITLEQSPPVNGIYSFEGNKLKLCLMVDEHPNAGFPKELVSQASPKTDLLILELETSATSAVPTPPASDDHRSQWHYVNAPLIFPGQTVTEGIFRKHGVIWYEERVGDQQQDWKETARTPEYVELSRPLGDFFVRLYNDRSDYRRASQSTWTPMFPGKWEEPMKK